MLVITTDPARVHMTARVTGNAARAWRITVTTMKVFPAASSQRKRRQPTTGALKTWQGIRDFYNCRKELYVSTIMKKLLLRRQQLYTFNFVCYVPFHINVAIFFMHSHILFVLSLLIEFSEKF